MGGIELSYVSESSSVVSADVPVESSANEIFFISTFHSVTNLITSFFSWSIDTFGNIAGRILGWLGVGTPALFILWIIKKIIGFFFNKHIVSPFKRAVNKQAIDRYGTNVFKNNVVDYKRDLTKRDILNITDKYGVRTYKGLWANEEDFMSYDDLRNDDDVTMGYLRRRFKDFPYEFYNTLMELREA